jgi:hypothetical protein
MTTPMPGGVKPRVRPLFCARRGASRHRHRSGGHPGCRSVGFPARRVLTVVTPAPPQLRKATLVSGRLEAALYGRQDACRYKCACRYELPVMSRDALLLGQPAVGKRDGRAAFEGGDSASLNDRRARAMALTPLATLPLMTTHGALTRWRVRRDALSSTGHAAPHGAAAETRGATQTAGRVCRG